MPELPEVETCRRKLEPVIRGKPIEGVEAATHNYAFLTPPDKLKRELRGRTIEKLERRGKYLLMRCSGGGVLLIHLGMTGQIFVAPRMHDKHVNMMLYLKGLKHPVVFRDPRKFGKLLWLEEKNEAKEPRLARLGPDALAITGSQLWQTLHSRKASIKTLLLNQAIIAGVGNIYADEALFIAGIRPIRAARSIAKQDMDKLALAIKRVLKRAVKLGGSSISDYLHPDGETGYFQIEHKVYGRAGLMCPRCQGSIKRIVIGQRSAHYCPKCQR